MDSVCEWQNGAKTIFDNFKDGKKQKHILTAAMFLGITCSKPAFLEIACILESDLRKVYYILKVQLCMTLKLFKRKGYVKPL